MFCLNDLSTDNVAIVAFVLNDNFFYWVLSFNLTFRLQTD